jgi:hypothetical protein
MSRSKRRFLAVMGTMIAALTVSLFAWAGVASANRVSDVEANCSEVTVHFVDFPAAGITVHIAATVQGQAPLATDVLVKNDESATLDISSATSGLFGASATVDVDVTWAYFGTRHLERSFSVTCGSTTTTSVQVSPTTATTSTTSTTSTSTTSTTSTTVGGQGGTTTTVAGSGGTTSTTVESGTVVPNGSGPHDSVNVLGESVSADNSTGSLPFTGSSTPVELGIGLGLLTVGTAVLARARRAS